MTPIEYIEGLKFATLTTTGEKLTGGLIVTLFSMAIVFSVLVVLIFIVKGMGKLLAGTNKKVEPTSVVSKQVAVEEADEDPYELIAVISAAIAESMGKSASEIRVKRINRMGGERPAWSRANDLD